MQFIVPLNRDTEHIFYNQRIIYDAPVLTEPRAWLVSKVNRIESNGLVRVTMAQDLFDPNRDLIEKDEYGNVIGMWADAIRVDQYTNQSNDLIPPNSLTDYHAAISFSGVRPVIKVNGNYKKFTVNFYDKHGTELEDIDIDGWEFSIDGTDIMSLEDNPFDVVTFYLDNKLNRNQIKIKCSGSDKYLGKTLNVKVRSGAVVAEQNIEIVGV